MALYALIEKVSEDAGQARYQYSEGTGFVLGHVILDKAGERLWIEDGEETYLSRAVVRKIAVHWATHGVTPVKLAVQS
ncbi:hypothetical protein [Nonomuraea sp. NPDC003709]|uniref:hypothetical protein n=1 Tax=Nonomuraea sp. NPDC003709 TaxID=3154450 RepID=UPI0033BB5B34